MTKRKTCIQNHHIIYASPEHKQGEVTVKIYGGEHWLITQLNRHKYISKGLVKSLKVWLALNEDRAVDL